MLSIILTANNEKYVGKCVLDIQKHTTIPHEIIVVVDDVEWKTPLESIPRSDSVRVVVNKERLGVAKSRNIGAAVSGGQVLTFSDAHVWVKRGSYDSLYHDALEQDAIIVPAFGNFRHNQKGQIRYNFGSGVTFLPKKWWFYLYVVRFDIKKFARRGGCHAVGMTMKRTVFDKMDGWARLPGYWSSNDVAMSLKAKLTGTPILLEPDVKLAHMIRSVRDHQTPRIHQVVNRYYTAAVLFSEKAYRTFWFPNLAKRWALEYYWSVPGWKEFIAKALDQDVIAEERKKFRACVTQDEEIILGKVRKGKKIAV